MKKAVMLAALLGATGLAFGYFQLRAKEKEDSSADIDAGRTFSLLVRSLERSDVQTCRLSAVWPVTWLLALSNNRHNSRARRHPVVWRKRNEHLDPKSRLFVAPDEVRFRDRFNILSTPRLVAPKLRHLFPDLFLPFRSLVILG